MLSITFPRPLCFNLKRLMRLIFFLSPSHPQKLMGMRSSPPRLHSKRLVKPEKVKKQTALREREELVACTRLLLISLTYRTLVFFPLLAIEKTSYILIHKAFEKTSIMAIVLVATNVLGQLLQFRICIKSYTSILVVSRTLL